MNRMRNNRLLMWAAVTAACAASFGCAARGPEGERAGPEQPLTETVSRGPVEVTLTAEPQMVEMDRDVLLVLRVTAPPEVKVVMPDLGSRLAGFALAGVFDKEPSSGASGATVERHASLTPILGREHRIAPMAFIYEDARSNPPETGWCMTPPIVFKVKPPVDRDPGGNIAASFKAVWIGPSFSTVVLYTAAALAVVAAVVILFLLAKRVHHSVQLARMSPRERALRELRILLAKDLIARQRVKDFYLELTMIVRRYIERSHGIRAPEQTTEEFLKAVGKDGRFKGEVVLRLKAFLEAADLVKFAAHKPDNDAVERATDTARRYIETDAGCAAPDQQSGHGHV